MNMKRSLNANSGSKPANKLLIRFSYSESDDYDEYNVEEDLPKKKQSNIKPKYMKHSENELYSYSSYTDESSSPISFVNQGKKKPSNDSRRSHKLLDYDSDLSSASFEKRGHKQSQSHQSLEQSDKVNHTTSSSTSNSASQNAPTTTTKSEPLPLTSNLSMADSKPPAASSLRLLDRYKNTTNKFSQFFGDQTVTYILYRKKIWKKSAKRKLFQLADSGNVIAGAECVTSKLIEISNDRGLISEMDIKSYSGGPFVLRMGNDKRLEISISSNRQIIVEFVRTDEESTFPYTTLISQPPSTLENNSFGNRPVIKSVKNCKLCNETGKEIVSVRKIKKNALAIDAKKNISFVSVMAIGLFMFLYKA
ncbi:hypothetical protein M9Y10_008535 [Tritrichomonas musculus]|uniref:Tubby C-terminal domain-containing protein n=1 Tax=Tritrichomonas musculus TaxID=1915356 RepID=A0ABR2IYF5_9EUKA